MTPTQMTQMTLDDADACYTILSNFNLPLAPTYPSMANYAPPTLTCLIEGESSPFRVKPIEDIDIIDLKDLIKEKRPNSLGGVYAANLTLWKVDLVDPPEEELSDLTGKDVNDSEILEEFQNISNYWPAPDPNHLHIMVEVPRGKRCEHRVSEILLTLSRFTPTAANPDRVSIIFNLPPNDCLHIFVELYTRSTAMVIDMVPTSANRAEFTMKIKGLKCWDHLCRDDLRRNDVVAGTFLEAFQERLRRKRHIDNGTRNQHAECLKSCLQSLDPYFDLDFDAIQAAESDIPELDRVTTAELFHYLNVLCNLELTNIANYDENKESQLRYILLQFFAVRSFPDVNCAFRKSLPFHLVIESLKSNEETMRYTPQNDFHMSIRNFPHILLEVNESDESNESDEYRMLLQAACMSRIGNWLRGPSGKDPIVIMAIYIDKHFMAHQHILCQPDVRSSRVEYSTNAFDLRYPRTAFEFFFQMYNFFTDAMDGNVRLHDPRPRLDVAKKSVSQKRYPTLTFSKRKYAGAQRQSKKSKPNPGTSAQGGEENSWGNPSVMREVAKAGYTPTQPISKELTPMTPLKPTMCKATSRSGALVILKTIVDSDERQLLHYLSGIKEPSNHTIPLLDVIDLSIEKTIIVLPWKSPLDGVLRYGDRPDDVVSLCLQFIEGVAFFHRHNIAHCDLKPDNVVVDRKSESRVSPQLFIIDFGLALHVESEETMMEGCCGTPSWIAPELGSRNGPIQRYSPILADRWACGRMIEYFAKYFPIYEGAEKTRLLAFAKRLLDVDPRARPEVQLQAVHGP